MGTHALMSTLVGANAYGYGAMFSGKLSSVTTHSENPVQGPPTEAQSAPAMDGREVDEREVDGREVGGREGPEPTRFGDWELRGRCIDF